MSIQRTLELPCPSCGAALTTSVYDSIHAGRRPDLKAAIVDGTLHRARCDGCGGELRAPPSLTYLDVPGGLVVLALPAEERAEWRQAVDDSAATVHRAFGHGPGARLLDGVTVRVVFGWAALREKVVLRAAGLDDVDVEILKLAVIRSLPEVPFDDALDLRVLAVDDGGLRLAWVDVETETVVETLAVPADAVASVDARGDAWRELREELTADAFVDHGRLLLVG